MVSCSSQSADLNYFYFYTTLINSLFCDLYTLDIYRFGERQLNGFGSRYCTTPQLPPTNRRSRQFRQQPAPLAPPPAVDPSNPTSPFAAHAGNSTTLNNEQQQQQIKSRFSWNQQQTPSSPITTAVTPEQQRQAQILQELPGIGTWAGRQRLFSVRPLSQVPNSQVEDDILALEATESAGQSLKDTRGPAVLSNSAAKREESAAPINGHGHLNDRGNGNLSSRYSGGEEAREGRHRNGYSTRNSEAKEGGEKEEETRDGEDEIAEAELLLSKAVNGLQERTTDDDSITALTPPMTRTTLHRTASNTSSEARHISAAWKWRFTRKWEAEQRRVLETDPTVIAAEIDGGDDLDALEYLHACGMGLDLQMIGDVQQRRKPRGTGRGTRGTRGDGRGTTNANANTAVGGTAAGVVNGRIKSGIINAPEPSRPAAETGLFASLRRDASSVSTATMQFEVEPSYTSIGDLLSCEASENFSSYLMTPDTGGGGNGGGGTAFGSSTAAATRDLLSVAVRGRELLQRQTELEREAAAKWEEIERNCCGGVSTWAGNVVPPVDIAMHGKFYFVVLRMSEVGGGGGGGNGSSDNLTNGTADGLSRNGSIGVNRQRMLVRGRPKATPHELLEETIAQAATACSQKMLPYVSIALVGAGEMEWRQDTDRHLMVSPAPKYLNLKTNRLGGAGVVLGGSPPEVPCNDVCALAASLLHQALPLHFNISTRAQSLASHASGTLL